MYLIPVTSHTSQLWRRWAAPKSPARNSDFALIDEVLDRTTCNGRGRFEFSHLRSGPYYLYSPVFWTNTMVTESGRESTFATARPWVGTAWVPAGDTVQAALRCTWTTGFAPDSTWEANRALLEERLDKLLRAPDRSPLIVNESPAGRLTGWIDLNGDERLDALVLLRPRSGWDKKGSSLLVFLQRGDSLVFLSRSSRVRAPICVSRTIQDGWREVFLTRGSSGEPGQYVVLRFEGGRYAADAASADSAEIADVALPHSILLVDRW